MLFSDGAVRKSGCVDVINLQSMWSSVLQERTVQLVVKLLSPSDPVDYSGRESQLIKLGPMLNVILSGISAVDYPPIFSFHGLVWLIWSPILTSIHFHDIYLSFKSEMFP